MTLTQIKPAGLSTPVDLADNARIRLGTGNDLQIYHDGSNSYIEDAGTGVLLIKSNTLYLTGTNAANDLASFVEGGAVSLYYDDVKKFETTSYGNASAGQVRVTSSNASTVAFSCGDVGTGLYNAGGNTIGYSVNGTEKLRIDSSGRLLHGVTASVDVASTASAQTQIHSSNSTVQFAIAGYGNNAGGSIFALGHSRSGTVGNATGQLSNNDEIGTIRFAPSDGTDMENTAAAISGIVDGNVSSNSTPGAVIFYTNNGSGQTEKLRIRAAGGITFNGDTAAANALDDYEEGTWTPSIVNGGSPSYSQQSGLYTKIGNLVRHTFVIGFSGASLGNSSRIGGLPFAYNSTFETNANMGRMGAHWNDAESAGSRVCHAVAHTGQGTTRIYVDLLTSGTDKTLRGFFEMRVP